MLSLHYPRMDNALWPLGAGGWGLPEWSGGDSSAEGGLLLRLPEKPARCITDSWPRHCPPVPGGRCVCVCLCEGK